MTNSAVPLVVIALAILGVAAAHGPLPHPRPVEVDHSLWASWTEEHGKTYHLEESIARFNIFRANMDFIQKHNAEYAQGKHSFTVRMNHFGDLTREEFEKQYMSGLDRRSMRDLFESNDSSVNVLEMKQLKEMAALDDITDVPAKVDWREKGKVTVAPYQGSCNSCTSFATSGAVESAWAIKTGNLVKLSEQQLVDCVYPQSYGICYKGGITNDALKYLMSHKSMTESSYPYAGYAGQCRYSESQAPVPPIKTFHGVLQHEYSLTIVLTQQPVIVAIDPGYGFQFYSNGVYGRNGECSSSWDSLSHAMVAVGYGQTGDGLGTNLFILRNSYGSGWGSNGSMFLHRNPQDSPEAAGPGACGVALYQLFPAFD